MQSLLREFLYLVCSFNFHPVVSKIGTKENLVADFLSRNYNSNDAASFFVEQNLGTFLKVPLADDMFDLKDNW